MLIDRFETVDLIFSPDNKAMIKNQHALFTTSVIYGYGAPIKADTRE